MKNSWRKKVSGLLVVGSLTVLALAFRFMFLTLEFSPIRVVTDFENSSSPALDDFSFRFQSGFLDWWKREGKFELRSSSPLILRIMEEGTFFVCYLEETGHARKTLAKLPRPTAPGDTAFLVKIAMDRIQSAFRALDLISDSVYQRVAIFGDHLRFFTPQPGEDTVRGKWSFVGKSFMLGDKLFVKTEASRLDGHGKVSVEWEIPEEELEIPSAAKMAAGELRRQMAEIVQQEKMI